MTLPVDPDVQFRALFPDGNRGRLPGHALPDISVGDQVRAHTDDEFDRAEGTVHLVASRKNGDQDDFVVVLLDNDPGRKVSFAREELDLI